uniref:Myosin-J heavy chain-like n=1 Tax=Phallusia mammillata TaxID=59560 RepID=A0A6F9DEK8_9ASCI|nr:myosin-J heavy chain-like [Phallusia mammillata]
METSSQTDQENDPVNVVPAVVTMEISSQTDHDNDPVYLTPAAVSMETSTQTDHEHGSMNIVPTVFSSYPTEAVDGSTQTYLDSDRHTVMPSFSLLNSLPLDNTVPKAFNEKGCKQICNTPQTKSSMSDENTLAAVEMVDSFTQTNHDEKPIASSPVCSPYKQRQISIDHGEKVCEHVLPSQSGQCDLHSSYILEQSMDNDSSYMSHESLDRLPLNHHPRQCMQCGNSIRNVADANTQTHHDLQPVYSRSNYNLQLVNTETQTEVSRIKSLDLTDVKSLVRTDIHLNSYFPSANDVSVQTCNEQVENEVILCNMSCQTEHDCKVPKTQTNYLTFESSTQTEHNNTVVGKPWLEPRFLSDVKANSISSQTVLSDNTSSDQCYRDNICKHCGRLPSQKTSIFVQTEQTDLLSSLPNPTEVARILSSGDAAKLKAYKNTVNVLKRKLKAAQETISEQGTSICSLQDELAALKSLLESKTASEKAVNIKEEGLGLDRLQEELRHWKGVAENKEFEISSLKSEIEKLKHGYETETEKQARKSFAQRKLQEKKIKDANERVVALVDANGKLRRSVEKLQIKLTTCSQQLEIGQREKLRYQNRARKLQANLRSLSWLSNSEDKATEKCQTKSLPEETKLKKRNSLEIPSSVKDIENVLSNLKCEISSLERQLSDHNAVVNQSKASWKEIRRPLLSENKSDSVETMQAVDDGFGEIV